MKKNLEIIIADDHRIYRKSLKRIVKKLFPESHIQEAKDGLEFLKLLSFNKYVDLVLMDVKMPVMDGVEATGRALSINPTLKILAISIYNDENKQRMLEAGAQGFLQKGGDKYGIKQAISTVLRGEIFINNI